MLEYSSRCSAARWSLPCATPGALAYLDLSCNTIGAAGEGFEVMQLVFVFLGSITLISAVADCCAQKLLAHGYGTTNTDQDGGQWWRVSDTVQGTRMGTVA
jgi:hypothetical protein